MYRAGSNSSTVSRSSGNIAPAYTGLEDLRGRKALLEIRRPALAVIDAQRIFLDPASPACLPDADRVVSGIASLVRIFRARKLPVVFTRHIESVTGPRGTISTFFPRPLAADDPLSEFPESIATMTHAGESFIKSGHDAFCETLPEGVAGSDALFLAGVQTPLCVLATALGLARRHIVPIVIADACAARDEVSHVAAIRCLGAGHAHIRFLREVPEILDSSRGETCE